MPAIVTNAINSAPNSPQSITGSPWATDASGGDGGRIRNAITAFNNWINTKTVGGYSKWANSGRPNAPTTVQNTMRANLNTYSYNDNTLFIEQIRQKFAGVVPADDNGSLALLQMRAQCKEFADRIVNGAGGHAHVYGQRISADVRPGMYAFAGTTHSAIITEVKFDSNGNPWARLAEANRNPNGSNVGGNWTNPGGQVPWLRTVNVGREVSIGSTYKASLSN